MPGNWNWTNSLASWHVTDAWTSQLIKVQLGFCSCVLEYFPLWGSQEMCEAFSQSGYLRGFFWLRLPFSFLWSCLFLLCLSGVEIQVFWGFESISCEWPTDGGFAFSVRAADHRWAEASQKTLFHLPWESSALQSEPPLRFHTPDSAAVWNL